MQGAFPFGFKGNGAPSLKSIRHINLFCLPVEASGGPGTGRLSRTAQVQRKMKQRREQKEEQRRLSRVHAKVERQKAGRHGFLLRQAAHMGMNVDRNSWRFMSTKHRIRRHAGQSAGQPGRGWEQRIELLIVLLVSAGMCSSLKHKRNKFPRHLD